MSVVSVACAEHELIRLLEAMMHKQLQQFFSRRNRPAWWVLAVCLLLVALAWYGAQVEVGKSAQRQFDLHVHEVVDAIVERLRQHEQILLGGAGLFDASNDVNRQEWRAYVERLNLGKNYPGIQGVGFSQIVWPEELPAHIAAIRAEGFPQYTVHPAGTRPFYTSIVYLEPYTERNQAAFGFDMMSEATRAQALRLAVETGKTTITGKVKLVQEIHGKVQAGFLMYLPIYRRNQPLGTVSERWSALQGFVYSPYRVDDLMRGIMGSHAAEVDFIIFDGEGEREDARMYDSREAARANYQSQLNTQRTINAYGNIWTVRFQSPPEFEASFESPLDLPILALGGITSMLLFMLVTFLISRRDHAEQLARQMTEEIRRSEAGLHRFKSTLDQSLDFIVLFSIDNLRFTYANRGATAQVGYSYDELLQMTPVDIKPEFTEASFRARLQPLLEGSTNSISFETVHRHKDGHEIPIEVFIQLVHELEQEPLIVNVARDITERKAAEQNLRESVEQTQAILDNVVDGIITINSSGKVRSLNQSAERIFGYTADEVIGNNVSMLMPEPYHSQHDSYLENYRVTGVQRIIGIGREVEGLRKDGSTFPMDLAVSRSTHQGQPLFIGLVRDITERRRVERMKMEFVSTVSHELRTPLTSISGALGLMAGGVLGEMPERAKHMLDIAHKNSLRLTVLINDLLDMEKLAAGKIRFDFQAQPLMPLVEQALEASRAYAAQFQVRFELVEQADNVQVRVDSTRLQQVLANLLSNAAKFSPDGGLVEIIVRQHADKVRVNVIDRGPGIPAEFHGRIFQKFSQADASDTRQKGGTGLGLAISKELIEHMRGQMGFESEEGKGACFYFDLPVHQARAMVTQLTAKDPSGVSRVLVVESDLDNGRLLGMLLSRADYQVDIVTSGEVAMGYLAHNRYAAVTLGLTLPGHSCVALFRHIRGQPETETLPTLMVSAYVEEGALVINGDAHVLDWFGKPVDEARLISAVRRGLAGQSVHKARVLHVEDDSDLQQIIAAMGGEVADFDMAQSLAEARKKLAKKRYHLVILDIGLPDGNGWELLPQLKALNPELPVIVLSGTELSQKQLQVVQTMLLGGQTSNQDFLEALKRLTVARENDTGDATP